jgi:hypothetical protein
MAGSGVKGGGIMLPIRLVTEIEKHRKGSAWSRSAIIWDLVTQGVLEVVPDHPDLIVRQSPDRLKSLATTLDPFYDHTDTTPGVLKGYSVSTGPSDRALVFSIDLDLGDNPSYALRIRYLIRLGIDRLLRGVVE